jgi:hypothetical protein
MTHDRHIAHSDRHNIVGLASTHPPLRKSFLLQASISPTKKGKRMPPSAPWLAYALHMLKISRRAGDATSSAVIIYSGDF